MSKIDDWRKKCYAEVPQRLTNQLLLFRSLYPYKKLMVKGQEWQYIITDGGPEVVLMLPGSTATGESNWREIPRFLPDYRVLSISYPPVKSITALLEGIITILDTERIVCVNIIGASMGGAIAHWLIRKYPKRVNKLVIMSLGIPDNVTAKKLREAASTFLLLPNLVIRKMFEREANRLVSSLPEDEALLMSAYCKDQYKNDMNKRTIIGHFRLVAELASKISSLGLDKPFVGPNPVLIINAADDDTVSLGARNALYATYPNSQVIVFPSGGHTLFSRREELFNAIVTFIKN